MAVLHEDHFTFLIICRSAFKIKQMFYYVKNTTIVHKYWYFIIATCFGHISYVHTVIAQLYFQ